MGTVSQTLDISAARPDTTNTPELVFIAGTNFPAAGYAFPQSSSRAIYLQFKAAQYGSGNITLALTWYSRSGSTTGSVQWTAALAAITPGDATSVEAKSFATSQNATTTVNGTAKGDTLTTITVTNLDSIAAGDDAWIKITRTDTSMVGDAVLIGAELSYSDGNSGTPGAGDVVGPASATNNALTRYDSTTGKLVKNGPITCDDSGNLSGVGTINSSPLAAPQVAHLTAGFSVTSATLADVTGLSISIASAGTYLIEGVLHTVQSSTTSSTFSVAINFSGTITRIMLAASMPNSATAVASIATQANNTALVTGARTTTTAYGNLMHGILVCTTSGTLTVRAARSATNTTVGEGSYVSVTRVA